MLRLQAYLAARRAHELDPFHAKARFRLARALLHLRCYQPAQGHLQELKQQVGRWVGVWQSCAAELNTKWLGRVWLLTTASSGQMASLALCGCAPVLRNSFYFTNVILQMPTDKSIASLLRTAEGLVGQSRGRFDMPALLSAKTLDAASGGGEGLLLADWVGPVEVFHTPAAGGSDAIHLYWLPPLHAFLPRERSNAALKRAGNLQHTVGSAGSLWHAHPLPCAIQSNLQAVACAQPRM